MNKEQVEQFKKAMSMASDDIANNPDKIQTIIMIVADEEKVNTSVMGTTNSVINSMRAAFSSIKDFDKLMKQAVMEFQFDENKKELLAEILNNKKEEVSKKETEEKTEEIKPVKKTKHRKLRFSGKQ